MTAEILAMPSLDLLYLATDAGTLVRRYKCRVCGKVTRGRLGRGGPDETGYIPWYPRKHGSCHGATQKAIYVYVPEESKPRRRSA